MAQLVPPKRPVLLATRPRAQLKLLLYQVSRLFLYLGGGPLACQQGSSCRREQVLRRPEQGPRRQPVLPTSSPDSRLQGILINNVYKEESAAATKRIAEAEWALKQVCILCGNQGQQGPCICGVLANGGGGTALRWSAHHVMSI